eukprot:6955345-Prorocentrum_lima.AAC.1
MEHCKPVCGVVAPPCTGMKGLSALNRLLAPDAWHRSRMVSAPLGQLAGEIALYKLEHERHFLIANPQEPELFALPS